jgi:hypothetical protein
MKHTEVLPINLKGTLVDSSTEGYNLCVVANGVAQTTQKFWGSDSTKAVILMETKAKQVFH